MGFYPVNPVSAEYVVGSPLFEYIQLRVPNPTRYNAISTITITAPGARTKPYVKSLKINGVDIEEPVIRHRDLLGEEEVVLEFEMSEKVEKWGNDAEILKTLGVEVDWTSESGAEEVPLKTEHDEL